MRGEKESWVSSIGYGHPFLALLCQIKCTSVKGLAVTVLIYINKIIFKFYSLNIKTNLC